MSCPPPAQPDTIIESAITETKNITFEYFLIISQPLFLEFDLSKYIGVGEM